MIILNIIENSQDRFFGILTDKQKKARVRFSIFKNIVTDEKAWFYKSDPEKKVSL